MATFGSGASSNVYSNPNNDYNVPQPIQDGIQSLSWSPSSNTLVAGSWDNCVRCWDVQHSGTQFNAVPKAQITHDGPVLCTAFSGDGSTVFSGSCDKTAKMWNLSGPAQGQQIAAHDAPIRCIAHIQQVPCVVTASWDRTIKYWDTRSSAPLCTLQLSDRCYAMDAKYPLLVVGTADRQINIIDIRQPSKIYKTVSSSLKCQTRAIGCFPDATGFAVGSIEARASIQHVEEKDKEKDFSFKCHRDGNDLYSVNSITFHPLGTFATAGGDGSFGFWDKDARQKLKTFTKSNQSITCGAFNAVGDIYAYALSYDWSMGSEKYNASKPSVIRLHNVLESEIQPKKK